MLIRSSTKCPDLLQLVDVRSPRQNRSPHEHLAQDTSMNTISDDRPGQIANNAHPIPHISTSPPYCLAPNKSSGGLYHLVTTQFVYLRSLPRSCPLPPTGSNARAKPKSAMRSEPSLDISRLAAFMSRCRIWF